MCANGKINVYNGKNSYDLFDGELGLTMVWSVLKDVLNFGNEMPIDY